MTDTRIASTWIAALIAAGVLLNTAAIVRYAHGAEPGDARAFYQQIGDGGTVLGPRHHRAGIGDPRPHAWCGWQVRQWLGVADRAYNLARNWAHYGRAAFGPAPGVIAVYPHHVGIVTSVPRPGVIVLKSGNDGHAVRERERSTRGVIAWRVP